MAPTEAILIWIAIGIYALASALSIFAFVFRKETIFLKINYIVSLAFFVHTAAIVARWYAVGNLPVAGDYESALGGVWVIMLFYLFMASREKQLRGIGVAILPFSLILLGYGVMRVTELAPMAASVRSFWLYIHVLFAWLAFGSYTIDFGLGVVYVMKAKNTGREFYEKFPSLERIDELMFRYLIFGFITDAVMIASGAIWAKNLWGNYWSWDPVETWSLTAWLIYGLAIHLRLTMGWKGRRFAWIMIFALIAMVIAYFGINLMVKTSLHIFDAWQQV